MKNLLGKLSGFWAFLAVYALASSAAAQPVPAPIAPYINSVSVSGEAKEEIAPDQATLSVSLVSRDKVLDVAKKDNDALLEKLVKVTRDFSIPKEKIATSALYINPEYNYRSGKQEFVGYIVNRSLVLTIDKLEIHERLLSALVDAKIDQVGGLNFQLADPEAHAAKLRVKAFENAKAKAEALAKAAGAKLGKPMSISAGAVPPPMPIPRMMEAKAMMMAGDAASEVPSLPGLITLHENVSVTFELE